MLGITYLRLHELNCNESGGWCIISLNKKQKLIVTSINKFVYLGIKIDCSWTDGFVQ